MNDQDIYLFNEGRHFDMHRHLGAHVAAKGVRFSVWAPNAKQVFVMGDFNGWEKRRDALHPVQSSGVWSGFIADARAGQAYKYHIVSHRGDYAVEKADPYAFCTEKPPATASIVCDLSTYRWRDAEWMRTRGARQRHDQPMSVYEVHLGSWRHGTDENGAARPLTYAEHAEALVAYVKDMGYTHIELMPVMEHPFGGSWGYQVTGYYAPTRRYGEPQDLMHLIDKCHQAGIGVILDWVPSHFPTDEHGLSFFDGTHLYEHADPRRGFHPDWKSCIFNYGRNEVRSFLISNALFWLEKYHVDGIRVDAVASMLYLDYSRGDGEWIPNNYGGRENLEAIQFLRALNTAVYERYPDVQMIAEESTSFFGVSHPAHVGGLGFGLKWDMGWMHDTLRYFQRDSVHRSYHQNDITFRALYAHNENFILPLSHDEVVHGKGSLIGKMPGDDWRKFANLRALYAYMYAMPGKKLMFMGGEFAQWGEWNHDAGLEWHLAAHDRHAQIQHLLRDLNRIYREHPSLHLDCDPQGFEWVDATDHEKSVVSYLRKSADKKSAMLCVFNFTPAPHRDYRIGVPFKGEWREIFNSDAAVYGGGDHLNGVKKAEKKPMHGRLHSVNLVIPPLAGVFLEWTA